MMDTDQNNYIEMIKAAERLQTDLEEWHDQFYERTEEAQLVAHAISSARAIRTRLVAAKLNNATSQLEEKSALLNRIKTGTTTSRDAILAERLMS